MCVARVSDARVHGVTVLAAVISATRGLHKIAMDDRLHTF